LAFSGTSYGPYVGTTSWQPGDSLGVSAAGSAGAVEAFSGSVIAPHAIAGLNPAPSTSTPVSISVANDFVITWTPGSDGSTVFLALEVVLGAGSVNTITCQAPVATGTLTAPSSLLGNLNGSGSILVHPQTTTDVSGANANVALLALGSSINGTATFH
jgi:hypothetical protein